MTGTGVSNWIRQAAIGPSLALGAFADTAYVLNRRVDELALYKRLLTAGERAWLSRNNGQGRAYTDIPAPPPQSRSAAQAQAYAYGATTWTKYYFAGTSRVASRTCSGTTCFDPIYTLTDHVSINSTTTWAAPPSPPIPAARKPALSQVEGSPRCATQPLVAQRSGYRLGRSALYLGQRAHQIHVHRPILERP